MLSTTDHGYVLPFEVVSMLLLSAMIGCIVIAIKPTDDHKKVQEEMIHPVPAERILINEVSQKEKPEKV